MSLFLLIIFITFTPLSLSSPFTTPDRLIKSIPISLRQNASHEYIELAPPLPSDQLVPSCSHAVLRHTFADTLGRPPVSVRYSPPSRCPSPWSHVVLEMSVSSKGDQYDRIAAVWLAGAEILRTSTAEPTEEGIFWKVRKDVTRYASLLKQSHLKLTVMLENVITDDLDGVYDVSLTLLYYKDTKATVPPSELTNHRRSNRKLGILKSKLGFHSQRFAHDPVISYKQAIDSVNKERTGFNLYETPADVIIPISGKENEGFWFRINSESDVGLSRIQIPRNTQKAALEFYVSFHGDDEFWYSNPPDSYIRMNNLTTKRGGGAYREVFVTIDGAFIGSVVTFPVIFTGGINPLFWEPVVAIGAFNLLTYDFDLTPFLALLLDGKSHLFGVGVAGSIPFWLVDANLHLWLDHNSKAVQARLLDSEIPPLFIERKFAFLHLDGSFEIEAKRKNRITGWVYSSAGNLTSRVLQQFRLKNSVTFERGGTYKTVRQRVKTKIEVTLESDAGVLINRAMVKRRYPLTVITSTIPGPGPDMYTMFTNVSHELREKWAYGNFSRSVHNAQDSWGWMAVKDHSVLSGSATTNQSLSYEDQFGCYSRTVLTTDGRLVKDNPSHLCGLPY